MIHLKACCQTNLLFRYSFWPAYTDFSLRLLTTNELIKISFLIILAPGESGTIFKNDSKSSIAFLNWTVFLKDSPLYLKATGFLAKQFKWFIKISYSFVNPAYDVRRLPEVKILAIINTSEFVIHLLSICKCWRLFYLSSKRKYMQPKTPYLCA